jgi:ligand-binding SRPBCC domain-containing protein
MKFVKQTVIRAPPERVFAFHERRDALELLTPPWEHARVIKPANIAKVGSRAVIETKTLGLTLRWVAEHTAYEPPLLFEDVQVSGPFRRWRHRHLVSAHADGALLCDEIDYEPPLGLLGRISSPWLIQPRLERLFAYRHEVTRAWCERLEETAPNSPV